MNLSSTQHRVARGVPAGGQFLSQERPDGEVVLVVDPMVRERGPLSGADYDFGEGPVPEADASTALSTHEALRLAHWYAATLPRSHRFNEADQEDIAQEMLLSVHVTVVNGRAPAFTPGLLASARRQRVAAAINTRKSIRHEDARARKKLAEAIGGRHLTTSEIDALAASIRNGWHDPRHKPAEHFHRDYQLWHLDAVADELERIPADEPDRNAAAALADAVEGRIVPVAVARDHAWNALAAEWGAPQAKPTVPALELRSARKSLSAAGGAAGAASSYLRGDVTASDGLFAPFPHADSAMRREVAESLLRYPHLADRLWDSASKQAQLPQEND